MIAMSQLYIQQHGINTCEATSNVHSQHHFPSHAEVLQDLAHDLVKGQYADKERAVAMLSSMTMYIDHHEVLLESGVLPALMSAVSNPKVEPTVRGLHLCIKRAYCMHVTFMDTFVHYTSASFV